MYQEASSLVWPEIAAKVAKGGDRPMLVTGGTAGTWKMRRRFEI